MILSNNEILMVSRVGFPNQKKTRIRTQFLKLRTPKICWQNSDFFRSALLTLLCFIDMKIALKWLCSNSQNLTNAAAKL